jgi:hypothetical protein
MVNRDNLLWLLGEKSGCEKEQIKMLCDGQDKFVYLLRSKFDVFE